MPLHRSRRHPRRPGQAKNSSTGEEALPSQPPGTELASENHSLQTQPPELHTQLHFHPAETPRPGTVQTEVPHRTSSAASDTGIPSPSHRRSSQRSPQPQTPTSRGSWQSPQRAKQHPHPLPPVPRSQGHQSRGHWRRAESPHRSPDGWLPLIRDPSPLWSLFAPSSPVPECSGESEQMRACSQEVSPSLSHSQGGH